MRSLDHARASWQELQKHKTLRELKDGVRLEYGLHSLNAGGSAGFRSASWKAFLLFDSLDVAEWQRTLTSSRSAYNSLRSHFFRFIDNPDDVGGGQDPLSQESEASPWSQVQKDEELRAEILQDVERCMPDNPYFRQPETQRILLDILFIFCKLNQDVGYRQGMHEIAAPIVWVVESEAIDVGVESRTLGEDATIKTIFDADYIEHDAFAIFGQVMQSAKTFYLSEGPVSIASRSYHIFNELLPQVDPELMKHLDSLDIVPQVFLIRWIRLLFGREFDFEAVLTLWDVIFAEDTSLELVDHVCLAMLLRIRWQLLDADYNTALGLLLKYPEQEKNAPAQSLGLDALYLQSHMTTEGGSYLVLKYTGRPLLRPDRPTTPPALQRNITTFSGINAIRSRNTLSPTRTNRQSRNIESVLQSTAKNIFAKGEQLGIGKAVRSAVEEVQKKAQEIRESQTPPSSVPKRPGTDQMLEKINNMEARNKQLSDLLASAVNELWDYQRRVTENDKAETENEKMEHGDGNQDKLEKLSTAIAKVQFVQVYLDQPSLSLPDEEPKSASVGTDASQDVSSIGESEQQEKLATAENIARTSTPTAANPVSPTSPSNAAATLADPDSFDDFLEPSDETNPETKTIPPEQAAPVASTTQPQERAVTPPRPSSARPPLEESPYSFMLGQGSGTGTFAQPRTTANDASLFGGEAKNNRKSSVTAKDSLKQIAKSSSAGSDDFDFGSLRKAKARK
ncbi:unnamed protein product [Zymoseptoria tritici ST99CH_1A5]|uniref:Rab-GAP TBC domain-containing protein n=2 Tax=Zymoseptoria tritici TaxID=1047171 RepID=A0A2H1GB94_ZYMTR|nr:unnamed protein product [Zymoseptoria tritici ST99CH_1E4]SMY23525.1 unnamed protein product [Zymoseptoria tritici ST99CH_1A5]